MSVGPMGLSGGYAAVPLAQNRASETSTTQTASDQSRAAQSDQRAEMAAGVEQTEEHGDAEDRDADGRRPWELPARTPETSSESSNGNNPPLSRDASHACGNQLDLTG